MGEQVTAYKCDYCGCLYSSEKSCQRHEEGCVYNPQTWEGEAYTPKKQPDVIYRRFPGKPEEEDDNE